MTPTQNTVTGSPASDSSALLVMLDPSTLLLDGNVRGTVHLDKDFLASIREYGVLVPIVAVRTDAGEHRVRYGQRRTLAAIETKRPIVPVYVAGDEASTDAATIERIVTQVHENEFRAGLCTADKTAAVEQLSLLGLSAAQIAKQVKGRRSDVDAALTVAGSKLAKRSTERYDFLTLDMAAAVAEFENEPQTVKALIASAKQGDGSFAHVAQRARDDRARKQACEAVAAELATARVTVIDHPGYSNPLVLPLSRLADPATGQDITPAGHKRCPGHVAYVSDDWRGIHAIYACSDWKAHGHRDRHRPRKVPAVQMSEPERDKARADRRKVIECNKAWPSATKVRRAWLRTLLAHKSPPKGAAGFVAAELAHGEQALGGALGYGGNSVLHELVGVKTKDALAEAASRASDGRAQVLALAFVLAAYEAATSNDTWRRHSTGTSRYFAFLAANGYELADVERLCLPKAPKKATANTPRRRAATNGIEPTDQPAGDASVGRRLGRVTESRSAEWVLPRELVTAAGEVGRP